MKSILLFLFLFNLCQHEESSQATILLLCNPPFLEKIFRPDAFCLIRGSQPLLYKSGRNFLLFLVGLQRDQWYEMGSWDSTKVLFLNGNRFCLSNKGHTYST